LGATVSLAVVDGEVEGPKAGLRALEAITNPAIERFQPAWTARAHLLAKAGRPTAAAEAYRRAIELTTDAGLMEYLRRRLAAVAGGSPA
jgi:RNA polymerase sigma-70 factor (ECF subfamily)